MSSYFSTDACSAVLHVSDIAAADLFGHKRCFLICYFGETFDSDMLWILQEIYDYFCDMDEEEEGYILEVSRSTTRLFDHMAALLAHPLQRPKQRDTFYKLTRRGDEESIL